jgi:YD repeat-containing protein
VDASGKPSGGEVYIKHTSFSQNGWNLPMEENDGRKTRYYSYYPQTNRLLCRSIHTGQIVKREYFEYDDNGVVVKEIVDDGVNQSSHDLFGATQRYVKTIKPTTTHPIGLPEVIEESYWDFETKTYLLIKKTINRYTPQGWLAEQKHYGSDGKLAYTLKWEYDKLGNVLKHTDALGQVITCRYDQNGNKIFEQGPRTDCHKKFDYDHANRLIKETEVWADGTQLVTSHTYNPLNQLTDTVDIYGQATHYIYDELGHLIETQLPALSINKKYVIPKEKRECNAMGHVISETDANGHRKTTRYTLRGQPCQVTYENGSVERKNEKFPQWEHHPLFSRLPWPHCRDKGIRLPETTSQNHLR